MAAFNYFSVPGIRTPDRITEGRILYFVTAVTGITYAQMQDKSRKRPIVEARHMAIYLLKRLTDMTLVSIANLFGGRDHTTAIHAIATIKDLMHTDEKHRARVEKLVKDILNNK